MDRQPPLEPPKIPKIRMAPASKASREESRQRVRYTMVMLAEGRKKSEIKSFFRKNYGVGFRQVERYLRKAKDCMVQETGIPKNELIAQSYAFYMSVIQDPNATFKDKLKARERADVLLGLEAPYKIANTTADGKDRVKAAMDDMSDEELRTLVKVAERHKQLAVNGRSGGVSAN
jgi:hypothetical protein